MLDTFGKKSDLVTTLLKLSDSHKQKKSFDNKSASSWTMDRKGCTKLADRVIEDISNDRNRWRKKTHDVRQSKITDYVVVKHKNTETSELDKLQNDENELPKPQIQFSLENQPHLCKKAKLNNDLVVCTGGEIDEIGYDENGQISPISKLGKSLLSTQFFQNVQYNFKKLTLPGIMTPEVTSVAAGTFALIADSMSYADFMKQFLLIDCRQPHEYFAGHIRGSHNISDEKVLEDAFFPKCLIAFSSMLSKIPIFYCEFSEPRATALASHLRAVDRKKSSARYNELLYKDIYVLEGGFKIFERRIKNKEWCETICRQSIEENIAYTELGCKSSKSAKDTHVLEHFKTFKRSKTVRRSSSEPNFDYLNNQSEYKTSPMSMSHRTPPSSRKRSAI